MKIYRILTSLLAVSLMVSAEGEGQEALPEKMVKIMQQPKYQHANWGILAKDIETGKILFDLNSDQLFIPGSVTKLYSVAAILQSLGDDYRFKTPVYMTGTVDKGVLKGDLILVGQGDLTLGGRQDGTDTISFTSMDHLYANVLPDAKLTKEDPLYGLKDLAKQVREKGITQIDGNILIDNRLFEKTVKRDMILVPTIVNENFIDLLINPTQLGQLATLSWRPEVPGYTVKNQVKTVEKDGLLNIDISSDEEGRNLVIQGTIPIDKKDVLRVFSVKDPQHFAQAAFIEALKSQGITLNQRKNTTQELPSQSSYQNMQPVAVWTSPPLSEYGKLILKVSHNFGADLVPLILASRHGEKTFSQGMLLLGKFIEDVVKIPRGNFVLVDAAGGTDNRLTPQGTLQLLEYMYHLPPESFKKFYLGLPILGVDGSLADFGKKTDAVGKVYAKTGTGMYGNEALGELFLATQALSGYIKGKNGHMIEYWISVNNVQAPEVKDVLSVFEDQGVMSAIIYDVSN
jgi:D-alanyl-D-alanine carboxypeptidase/D-alanyl-D-alanine-endopeptidase (penicillin-binding protein 4)